MTLALEDISFTYPGAGAGVRDVSLEIREGELLAVIGPSGCGKSTILKLIAGFLMPQQGVIRIGGQNVSAVPPRKRDLGIVFQSYALFPHMSVAENVGYPLKLREIPAADAGPRIREALEMVGLAHLADRPPRSLSGGQQQRVALARALVFRPRALLLDEPLSALDAAMRGEMRDEILRLQRLYGIATLHITHDQEEALSMANRVAVMRDGRLLQVDTPEELYLRPASRAVASFVGHANLFDGEVLAENRVRTPLGDLACQRHDFAPGARVSVLVRPEAIRPVAAADGLNRFSGNVTRDRFLGSLRRFDFMLPGGAKLMVETDHRVASPQAIELPPEAVLVIAPGNEGATKSAASTKTPLPIPNPSNRGSST
ncbi:MAG: ABC transporter ATP-binding protein [Rhabdaerophilum sp.]